MAKRKHAALFDVIHTDKRFPQRHSWTFHAPRWLTRRSRDTETASRTVSSRPWRIFSWRPSFNGFGLTMDPDRQLVSFQLSYTRALVSAFTLIIVIALAYVVGKHSAHRPMPALADATTDELRSGPAHADVLDVTGEGPAVAMASAPLPTPKTSSHTAAPTAKPASWSEPKAPTTSFETNSQRTIGLHYVIVQSYPPEERQLAEDAMKLLNQNGILCTVETGLAFAPRWFSVVGVNGYVSVRNSPDYDNYVAHIEQVGEKFGNGVKFKKFKPMAFKWRPPVKPDAKAQ